MCASYRNQLQGCVIGLESNQQGRGALHTISLPAVIARIQCKNMLSGSLPLMAYARYMLMLVLISNVVYNIVSYFKVSK